jgi:hypothetical protein
MNHEGQCNVASRGWEPNSYYDRINPEPILSSQLLDRTPRYGSWFGFTAPLQHWKNSIHVLFPLN